MPYFGEKSLEKLQHADKDLQRVYKEAIRISPVDFTIVTTHRPVEEQFELFKKGRKLENGIWVIEDKSKVVTNIDGINKKGAHNYYPSRGIDSAPYPIDWNDKDRFIFVGGVLIAVARLHGIKIRWGHDWDMDGDFKDQKLYDGPHMELL